MALQSCGSLKVPRRIDFEEHCRRRPVPEGAGGGVHVAA
jgi:hypothetical protein